MSYQVIARKWRPQTFGDVVGQEAVTRTLRNAITSGRLAHAFVFAGPRGVGKTTTARILARALSCVNGPTTDPCGECDACKEIADGRDIDVLEIDAATHTGVDNVREVIVSGLAITPVRDRYKVFIIDEVHQLSTPSFNALLKSIEEPPPHVVFMMATTELDKIPETVLSRAQVYEFRTITTKVIAEQLRKIVDAEGIVADEASLLLIARDAEGSMRDAQSKLDHVIAFTGNTIAAGDVTTVLGLVGRDLLLDTVQAVADEDAAAAFSLAGRAVEVGYDLRAVCRELARAVRDLLVLGIDPSRANDPEIVGEGERERVLALAGRFSREDLLRAFDLLTRAEFEIRSAAQPRYHFEMALLRWIHLRKLVPIEDLIAGAGTAPGRSASAPAGPGVGSSTSQPGPSVGSTRPSPRREVPAPAPVAAPPAAARAAAKPPSAPPGSPSAPAPVTAAAPRPVAASVAPSASPVVGTASAPLSPSPGAAATGASLKDALLAEIRKSKAVFYNTVVAQAQTIDVADDRVTFAFSPPQRALRDRFEQHRAWLEGIAQQAAGRRISVVAVQVEVGTQAPSAGATPSGEGALGAPSTSPQQAALREQALADAGVQALLEIFPAEIRDVEEIQDPPGPERGGHAMSMNIQQMMKQAQQMQERLQKQMADLRVEGNAGGGMVTVVVNGSKQIQKLTIDPEVVSKDDVGMLQDLIVAAINDANRKAEAEMAGTMGGMMGGLKIPGL